MGKYIDGSGLSHFMGILKGAFAAKSDAVSNITRSGTTFTATKADGTTFTFTQQDSTVAKTTTTPKMNGTAAIGTETAYAAGDHVHPTDTSRAPVSHASTATTYGAGNASNYGHVKLSDATDGTAAAASGGTAATPKAVSDALTSAKAYADGVTQAYLEDVLTADGLVAWDNASKDLVATSTITTGMFSSQGANKVLAGPASGSDTTPTFRSLVAADIPNHSTAKLTEGTLGVARGGTGASTLGAGVVYHSASGTGALSIATAANLVSALGTTAVNRATADASGNNIASTYATKSEVSTATAGALQYKGTATKESDISGQAYKKGWYYVVATAGTYFGKVCEVGDMLIAKQDKTSTVANDFDAVQSNIEVLSNSEIDALWAAA